MHRAPQCQASNPSSFPVANLWAWPEGGGSGVQGQSRPHSTHVEQRLPWEAPGLNGWTQRLHQWQLVTVDRGGPCFCAPAAGSFYEGFHEF